MMGSSRSLIIMALTLFALSLTSAQEELGNGKFRRLVRRKKQLMDLESQESRNIVRPSKPEDDLLEGRAVRPVKIKRRKIINGRPQKKVIKNSIIPKKQPTRTIINPVKNVSEPVAPKPNDAKRFLSLFTIVSFKNDACTSQTGVNGTCFSARDCESQGGIKSGTCASGFGVCCLFSSTCGGVTNINGTYFQSTGYPSTYDSVGSCQLTVNKCADSVCQLRLDVENMVLAQPEATDHKCDFDQFIVTGGSPIPAICGTNSGLHSKYGEQFQKST